MTMRLEVSRRADLAIRALATLGAADGRVKAGELAARLGTTVGFVPKVVAPLVERGWVGSDPGPAGGYHCTAALERISVLAVIEAVEGPTDTGRCVVADRPCDTTAPCSLHAAWQHARDGLLERLAGTPLGATP